MPITPAQAHYQRTLAARESAANTEDMSHATGYELMLAKLNNDKQRLRNIQSLERRAEIKRDILSDYAPYVEGVLQAGQGAQDDVLITVMLWRIDAGDYSGGLNIADYAISHHLATPDQYKRTLATVIAEEIATAAKRARDSGEPFNVTLLQQTAALTVDQDMPDQVRAKLNKEIGLLLVECDKPAALAALREATRLDNKAGVKKDIEKLERELKNMPPSGG